MTMLPEWVEPMAATLTADRFTSDDWIFERKFDGIRLLAYKRPGDVRLFSRNRLPQAVPAVASAIEALAAPALILDGELTWRSGTVCYHVFDVLWFDDRDLTAIPLDERRAVLESLTWSPPLELVQRVDGPEPWTRACAEGWEGVIAKRRTSPYEQKRSKHWLKMKCESTADFVVGGFTEPQGSRVGLGALLVGHDEHGDLVFAGRVGTGFDTALLTTLRARLNALEVPSSPFTKGTGLPRQAHWVRPEVVVQVAFLEWTSSGKMRHSRLLAVRPPSR